MIDAEMKAVDEVLESIGWETPIPDAPSFEVIPAGIYQFKVVEAARTKVDNGKLSGSNAMEMKLNIISDDGEVIATCKERLILHTKTFFKVREFWESVGETPVKNQAFLPPWNSILGRTGDCDIEINEFDGRDGQKIRVNRVKKYLPPKMETF